MYPIKEHGECLISYADEDYLFRPSFINITRLGSPSDIVQIFADLHSDEVSQLLEQVSKAFNRVSPYIISELSKTTYFKKQLLAAVSVLEACCDKDVSLLTGGAYNPTSDGRGVYLATGALTHFQILVIARDLLQHGVIGKAKIRVLQRDEGKAKKTSQFIADDYITSARIHFVMSREEAESLTMTEFQKLLSEKFPPPKGAFTREEYDKVSKDILAYQANLRARAEKRKKQKADLNKTPA